MDEGCCAVCAETLEWVAYGSCGHKDVCALCIARLRFVCHDLHCCICKSLSSSVFVTRELGSLTKVINDFSILPADAKDGKVGSYWFHEDTQAYFDDFDAYKIIKAMCKLSCSVCDKLQAEGKKSSKRRGKFKSVEQLKDHLSRQHDLFMCSLCLEYKKVFVSEQKLFSRVQLKQHIRYGDSEVDGCKNERCGFSGHPLCEFCQIPFYGDNELYLHMSTEHYTCHICQRQHSTQYEYYKDYNNLEDHFRKTHFLCEEDTCLEKKFIVFTTEADLQRHGALEHGGNMCRSKRRTALQLNTCFQYRDREEEGHRVRAHVSSPLASGLQLSSGSSANGASHRSSREIGAAAATVPSSGQLQEATLDFRSVLLSEFPPLPSSSKRRRRKSSKKSKGIGINQAPANSSSQSQSSDAGHVSHSSQSILPQIGSSHSTSSSSLSSVNSINQQSQMSSGIAYGSSANLRTNGTEDVGPSSLVSNLINKGSKCHSTSDENISKGLDIQAANKSLVEKIFASLEFDKDKFAAFKIFSKEYREGEIDAKEYLAYVHQFGLAHLIFDLARLCPDPQKQKELLEIHKISLTDTNGNALKKGSCKTTANKHSKKGKEKCGDPGGCIKGVDLPDNITNALKELKLNAKPKNEEYSLAGEHPAKGKSKTSADATEDAGHSNASGGKKKIKKKSKLVQTHLDEGSETAVPDLNSSDLISDLMMVRTNQDSILASVRGVWRNDGGRRLVAMSQSLPLNR